MRNRLPSMMSLRAFEAAARHLSFTRAAIELNLTQTAISHQIKNLEDLLQVKLFVRNANMIALTEVGEVYLRSVSTAILEISAATDRATDRSDENMLTVQCLGLFAIKRLLPHLHDFRAQHPAISLKLRTIQSFENNFHHDFDVAIWHGSGGWAGGHGGGETGRRRSFSGLQRATAGRWSGAESAGRSRASHDHPNLVGYPARRMAVLARDREDE